MIRGLMDKRVKKAHLRGNDFPNFSRLLDGVQIGHLDIYVSDLSDETVSGINSFIGNHEIPQLSLAMSNMSLVDPVSFLLELSRKFSAIHIDRSYMHDEGSTLIQNLLPIVVNMFSNKLDKMLITSLNEVPETASYFDLLVQRLPELQKCVWFEVHAACMGSGNYNKEFNNYVIQAKDSNSDTDGFLSIKHVSRVNEPFEL